MSESVNSGESLHVLGRRESGSKGLLHLGWYHALDGSVGAKVFCDALRPHVVLICGKRGYGKSYTIGVLVEELARLEPEVRRHLGVVVADTLGIFWTLAYDADGVRGRKRDMVGGIPVRLLVPFGFMDRAESLGVEVVPYTVRVSDLNASAWCRLFRVSPLDPVGIVVTRAIDMVWQDSKMFSLEDVLGWLRREEGVDSLLRMAAGNLFAMAQSWGVFSAEGLPLDQVVSAGVVSVLDLSVLPSVELKDVVVGLLADQVFEARVAARRSYERQRLGLGVESGGMPMVWLAVDEAQVFVPASGSSLCREVLVGKWMRQGRQPGLSLILASQRPSAVDPEVFAHCDLLVCHRVTALEDIEALGRVRPQYLSGDIGGLIKRLGLEKGVALVVDDTSESAHVIRVRPRRTWHAGEEPVALSPGTR